jgi:hypothetical protein
VRQAQAGEEFDHMAISRKLTVTLVLILFLLPFGSWYYLKSGLKWRQQVQTAMNGTTPVSGFPFHTTSGTKLTSEQINDHVSLLTILHCGEDATQAELVTRFYQQFKETKKANFIFFDTCAIASAGWTDSLKQNSWRVLCQDSLNHCPALLEAWPAGKSYALVDRKGIIRSYYDAASTDDKRIMLEHMALLIPREHGEKVELKRGEKQ